MKVLDLFSGIGGFSLGLERAGFETVAFCEIDPFCRRVLAKHWPEVPCYDDVRTLTGDRLAADGIGAVDVICGGFPCQDISHAGHRVGIEGERSGLWAEIARLAGDLRPRLILVENVSALLGRGLGRVLGDLSDLGYDAEWTVLSSCRLGAPHSRERLFLVAYPNDERVQASRAEGNGHDAAAHGGSLGPKYLYPAAFAVGREEWEAASREPALDRVADGVPDRVDRLFALGNAIDPRIPELIGRSIMAAGASCLKEAA